MGVLPVDDVTGQARRCADLLVGDRGVPRPADTLPGGPSGPVGGAACGIRHEHQQLDAPQGIYGTAGRAGEELDTVRSLDLVGLADELLDFSGEHVDVVRRQRNPFCWLQPTEKRGYRGLVGSSQRLHSKGVVRKVDVSPAQSFVSAKRPRRGMAPGTSG
ncbi:hypothetical protein [Streptomyces olivaceus]|uniref:hypothetical protein n=1 Tax=Streptomyces olivaceus TaxID=47716 RepID=UPI0024932659|nr:hypothetical protein [Streptomyces olivaceus]